tara:strand:+ start:5729 stop:6202 length:474 start_codon:yes stop_codon:yes gene_type:complete
MELTTTLNNSPNIYESDYDFVTDSLNSKDLNNKLFCTFTTREGLETLIEDITSQYDVMYNKMFILEIKDSSELVVTYNVDQGNVASIPANTILVHRKKETNTLYTINALNELIKELNGGIVDKGYKVEWMHYRNTILLTQQSDLKQLKTKIYKIIDL